MSFFELFLIAVGLSMDCFAVSLSFGAQKKLQRNDILKFTFFFALFQLFVFQPILINVNRRKNAFFSIWIDNTCEINM